MNQDSETYRAVAEYGYNNRRRLGVSQVDGSIDATGIADASLFLLIGLLNPPNNIENPLDVEVTGLCGNGVCEVGEICSGSSFGPSENCCPSDCAFPMSKLLVVPLRLYVNIRVLGQRHAQKTVLGLENAFQQLENVTVSFIQAVCTLQKRSDATGRRAGVGLFWWRVDAFLSKPCPQPFVQQEIYRSYHQTCKLM